MLVENDLVVSILPFVDTQPADARVQDFTPYLRYGNECWKRISDPLGRRDIGLFFSLQVLKYDATVFAVSRLVQRRNYLLIISGRATRTNSSKSGSSRSSRGTSPFSTRSPPSFSISTNRLLSSTISPSRAISRQEYSTSRSTSSGRAEWSFSKVVTSLINQSKADSSDTVLQPFSATSPSSSFRQHSRRRTLSFYRSIPKRENCPKE